MGRLARGTIAALLVCGLSFIQAGAGQSSGDLQPLRRLAGAAPHNVVFILADDHRYDAMGFMGHPIVRTPNQFIRYYGVWDIDELFDLKADPLEMHNLVDSAELAAAGRRMSARLFDMLDETKGRSIPLYPDSGYVMRLRTPVASAEQAAPFPPMLVLKPGEAPYKQ